MPKPYTVSRSAVIDAPADVVFALINDFHEWPKWSPWEDVDPDMTRTYSGAESGEGAGYAWSGNKKAGAGSMAITRSEPGKSVHLDLNFTKPFKADNKLEFTLTPRDGKTEVDWLMRGEHKGIMVLLSKVMSMDKMVGKDFEKGLARLQGVAKAAGQK